jgi:hypothetical protein
MAQWLIAFTKRKIRLSSKVGRINNRPNMDQEKYNVWVLNYKDLVS